MALGGKVVNFRGAYLADNLHDTHGVAQVGVVQMKVRSALQVGDALSVIY